MSSPSTAEIQLDGAPIGHGRAEIVRPRDGSQHVLHLSAHGFGDLDEVLVASSDERIERSLEQLAPPPSAPPDTVSPTSPAPAAPEPQTTRPATPDRQTHTTRPRPAVDDPPPDPRHPRMDRDIHL